MTSTVQAILNESQFTETIDGLEFVLRKVTGQLAAEVIGNKTLGLIRGGAVQDVDAMMPEDEMVAFLERYLTAAMISPSIAEESNAEADQISIKDLGNWGPKILAVVFEKSGFGQLGNFTESSEDTGGGN